MGPNKYKVKFDNGIIKEVTFNSLCIEEADSGILIEETAPVLELVSQQSVENNEIVNNSPDSDESDDILFPIDSTGLSSFNNSDNEYDSNDKIEINTRDINLLANTSDTNNTSSIPNQSQLTYYQKLKAK